ncbi:hypothetical protein ALC57_07909 [Trachymyrmex cornetzi]|uniref:SWIM-type domain-containing protein n=1 Tax=Trachymyrmex cornetzi TaxID=471704 RepID=A0A151J7E9_9HYME|nr:hypothetical protein ALC57_07909 [Trachymyrmex cornetzi]
MYFQNLLIRFRHRHNSTVRHLSCAMTHIDPCMKEDSLLFLDVLVQNCNSALAKDNHKILPDFLGMYVDYRKDEDIISIDNCEKDILPIEFLVNVMLNSSLNELHSIVYEDFGCFSPVTKEQFQDLFTYCDRVPCENGYRYVSKKDLLMFLCKLRQGLSDEFLKAIFQYPSRQATSLAVATSYSFHKGRHLLKPALIVAPDGYILEIQGPYFSDASNNDAALLQNEFNNEAARMNEWFRENDIIIVDRGYRDIMDLLTRLGITCKMPAFLQTGERQLSTEDGNESRLVTKNRWVVEARNGHLKSIFKFLAQVMQIQHLPNLGDFYRIAGAIINKYHSLIHMDEANAALAQRLLEKAKEPNVVQALIEVNNLHTRNAQRWVRLSADQLQDFPVLTLEFLKNLTCGIYQLELSPSYIQDKLQRDQLEEFQVEMLRNQNRLSEPGLMRVRVFSRFRNATKHQLWISYRPIGDGEVDENDGIEVYNRLEDDPPIQGYYCTCRSGARTLGTCVHVTSVLWFLGYARNQENVHLPSTRMIETIKDARNRPQQMNLR